MAKQSSKDKDTVQHFNELLSDIKNGIFRPFYLLMGEEPYYSDVLSEEILKRSLTEDEKGFNLHILYGNETSDRVIIESARRYPMMASRQVVLVREAQLMKQTDGLVHYFNQPMSSTILVIIFTQKSIDKRGSLYKSAKANGIVFESQALKDYQVSSWIDGYVKSSGYSIEPQASALMADFCGTELRKLVLECSKLFTASEGTNKNITALDIENNIGISREYNAFELGKSLMEKNMERTFKIVRHFGTNPKQYPLMLTLGSLFFNFSRLLKYHAVLNGKGSKDRGAIASVIGVSPYFIKDYETGAANYSLIKTMEVISLIRKYDSMCKSGERGAADDNDLLRELISKISH